MSTNRSRRIDRTTAEQLLAGATADSSAGQDRLAGRAVRTDHAALAGLIASAAAPAADGGELPGEQAALTAFREVHSQSSAAAGRRTTMTATATVRARAFSAKALLAALAATTLGGVAVAAGTGGLSHLPGGFGDAPAEQAPPGVSVAGPDTPSGRPLAQPSSVPSAQPSSALPSSATAQPSTPGAGSGASSAASRPGGSASAPGILNGSASPATRAELEGLCRAYAERLSVGEKARALAEPRFVPLVEAAGGADPTEYCTQILPGFRPGQEVAKSPTARARTSSPADPPTESRETRTGSSGADHR